MTCNTCDELRLTIRDLLHERKEQGKAAAFNSGRADKLQEACNRYKEEASTLRESLRKEQAKLPVAGLMGVAESAARIVESMAGVNRQTQLAWQARTLAEDALRQVRERLKEGDGHAGASSEDR